MARTVLHRNYTRDLGPASPEQIKRRRKDGIDGVLAGLFGTAAIIVTAPITGGASFFALPIVLVATMEQVGAAISPPTRRTKRVKY